MRRLQPRARRCASLLWEGGSLQLNAAGAIPKKRDTHVTNTPGGAEGSESPEGLTIRDEVLGYVKRHLDGQRAGELGAAHHGQDAGADGDQGQCRLVDRAFHRTCKRQRKGWVGGQ